MGEPIKSWNGMVRIDDLIASREADKARIAELEAALKEAIEWNWCDHYAAILANEPDDQIYSAVVKQVEKALGTESVKVPFKKLLGAK